MSLKIWSKVFCEDIKYDISLALNDHLLTTLKYVMGKEINVQSNFLNILIDNYKLFPYGVYDMLSMN